MTDTPLEPCPFCGGQGELYHHIPAGIEPSWHVECSDADGGDDGCGCGTCHHETKAEAIAAWNRRAPIAPPASAPGDVVERVAQLDRYTSHNAGCALYQRSWVLGEPPRTCGLEAARAAIAAMPDDRASAWRTMDSAPKDGTRFIASFKCAMTGAHFVIGDVAWHQDHWCSDSDGTVEPTHWQPLPAPPAIERGADREGGE